MYEDAQQELERLEKALLEEETIVIPQDDALLETQKTQKRKKSVKARNTDKTDTDMEKYAQAVMENKTKGLLGWTITVFALAAAIVAVLIFWLLRYGGMFS